MIDTIEWLNENGLRSFPFLTTANKISDTSYSLDPELILDLSLVYVSAPTHTYAALTTIQKSISNLSFIFTDGVSFTLPLSTTGIKYLRGTNNSAVVVNCDYFAAIPFGVNTFANLYVEPSLIFEYYNDWTGVTSLGFSPNYNTSTGYSPTLPLASQSVSPLTGDINFFEGYNFGIDFDLLNNQIQFTVGNSYGIPVSCSDTFIDPSLTDCGQIVSFINGVGPDENGSLNFAGGNNINIILGTSVDNFHDGINTGEPANTHSLFVGLNFYQNDLCAPVNIIPVV